MRTSRDLDSSAKVHYYSQAGWALLLAKDESPIPERTWELILDFDGIDYGGVFERLNDPRLERG